MRWHLSDRADNRARPLADVHYSRQNPGAPGFVPPGSCLVLLTEEADALWVTLAPFAEYVRHRWSGAWTCTLFRREPGCPHLASDLIRDAVAATRWKYGDPPEHGFITFIDRGETKPKRDPGYCYRMAGWSYVGKTQSGLYALQLAADILRTIEPIAPLQRDPRQLMLF
jgi:hypothetical protein